MGLETGNVINDLDPTWPLGTDPKSQGDDHLRLIKTCLQGSFPTLGAPGAADSILTSDGTDVSWLPPAVQPGLPPVNTLTPVALAGAVVDFVIPAGVHEISMLFDKCQPGTNVDWLVQIGTGGTPEVTGYDANCSSIIDAGAVSVNAYTTGFGVFSGFTAGLTTGIMTLKLLNSISNVWVSSVVTSRLGNVIVNHGGGVKAIAGVCDIVRLATVTGLPGAGGVIGCSYKLGADV